MKFKNSKIQKIKKNNGGMTLVELILYVALFMIFITGIVAYGVEAVSVRVKVAVEQNVIASSRMVSKRIAYEIRNATAINSLTAQSISLATADATRNPVVITKTGNKITIGWTGGSACAVATPCDLTNNDLVENLTFANMSDAGNKSASIKWDLTMSSLNIGGRKEWSYSKTIIGSAEIMKK